MQYEVIKTSIFDQWLTSIKDRTSKIRIISRLNRIENGNFGFQKRLDADLYEMKFTFGKGFRVYYTFRGSQVVLLVLGGDKSTQSKDIKKAKQILNNLE